MLIVGFGRIGQAVAVRAAAFGMRVMYYDLRDDVAAIEGTERVTRLDQGLADADVVSIHVDFNPASKHLIGQREISLMRPTALLNYTARGSVTDQDALYEALAAKRIAGAGLDVLDPEPPAADDPILQLPNVIIVPHIGSATRETRWAMVELAIANLLACLNGQTCEFLANDRRGH